MLYLLNAMQRDADHPRLFYYIESIGKNRHLFYNHKKGGTGGHHAWLRHESEGSDYSEDAETQDGVHEKDV